MFKFKKSLGKKTKEMVKANGGQDMNTPAFAQDGYSQGEINNPQQTSIVYGANSPDQYK